ncbi:MAG TPA: hypothetical protein VD902_04340 [Symbiobacteriaceae bacterium]|nr:hypothetical protein [Symbiobacteriaceae bacterium]
MGNDYVSPDLEVKHILARSTKKFFGYGPAGRVVTAIQGDLVIFAAEFTGPGILTALPQHPFGRLAMRYIADLYSKEVAPELAILAREQFGVHLRAVLSDLDYETGKAMGVALLDQPLLPVEQPAADDLAREVAGAIGLLPGAVSVQIGPEALVVRAPALAMPMGASAEDAFAALTAREAFRGRLRAGLVAALAARNLPGGPVFVTHSDAGLLAGVLFRT